MNRFFLGILFLAAVAQPVASQPGDALQRELQRKLDSMRVARAIPGVTLGVVLRDGRSLALASGMSDTVLKTAMRATDRMLQGSVGKTYVAAVALQLVQEGRLDLDAKISKYLGGEPWFGRLPNGADITVRQLMTHTSGLVRYEFQPRFMADLRAQPYREWTPADRLAYIMDAPPPFVAGQDWEYSDTNFIVLGVIIERIVGRPYYDEMRRRILGPLKLTNTIPSDRPDLPGVANGYAGPKNELGGYDASLVNGRFAANPGLEWTGGGIASTADDLARWAALLYEAKAFSPELVARMVEGVPSKLGPNTKYGLGAMIRTTPVGIAYGHSGFFPGYATEVLYFPHARAAVAIQANITDPYPRGLVAFLVEIARTIAPPQAP